MKIKILVVKPAYVLLHILIMSSCILSITSYAQQTDAVGSFININYSQNSNKKFISINQTEQDLIANKISNKQEIFTPKPTIASQRANVSGYSNINYNKKYSSNNSSNTNTTTSNNLNDADTYSSKTNNNFSNNNINTYSAVNTIKKPKDNKSIESNYATNVANNKNYINIKPVSNDAGYNSKLVSNSNNSVEYQQDAVIPFIVDSAQYKQASNNNPYYTDGNKYANQSSQYSTSNTNYPDVTNSSSNNGSISNVISIYNKSIPTNINNQNSWLPVDNALNNTNSSSYTYKTYSTISNAAGILLNNAKSLLGIPYRYGGNTPNDGLDCSGFVRYVFYYTLGVALPRRSAEIGQLGSVIEPQALKAGDLVFFNTRGRLSHLGIYMGNGSFIHAPSTGSRIRVDSLSSKYWSARYDGAKRIVALD